MTLKVLILWVFLCNLKLDLWRETLDSLDMQHSGFVKTDKFSHGPQSVDVVGFSLQSQARSLERNSGQFRSATFWF
jgi:hypothetical protein